MKGLLLVLIFAILKQNYILADDFGIQNAVKQFLNKTVEIRRRVDNLIKVGRDIQKDLPTILNEKISAELEKHPVVLEVQKYLNSSKANKCPSTECESLYDSKYNSLKKEIYQMLYKNIAGYYDEIKEVLTTRFQEELKEFERRVNDLHKSPNDVDFLTTKIDRAFKVISNIEIAQHNIIQTSLNYFKMEDSAKLLYDSLFVPFTECLNSEIWIK